MLSLALLAAATPVAGLQPLDFLAGHCWRAEFKPGVTDTHCFEHAYGGKHLRDRHEVTGGYAGETLYSWDGKAGYVTYTYWNSLGGVSRGTMKPAGDRLDFGDEAYTAPDGKQARIATWWKRLDADSYQAITQSPELPSMNRTVSYQRVPAPIAITSSKAADGTHVLTHETVVAAPLEQVWTAVATAEGWRGWAAATARRDGNWLDTGYDPNGPTTIRQQIDVEVPGRVFAFHTVKAPAGFPHFDSYSRVRSVIVLTPEGERRTRITLTGAGYPDTPAGQALLGFFRNGNQISLERLHRSLTRGPIDWSKEK